MRRADPDLPAHFHVVIDSVKLAETCARCPFTLVCLSGRPIPYAYICNECQAIWLGDISTLVDCDGFMMDASLDLIPGCEACEPLEIHPDEITRIEGYQAEETRAIHDPDED